MASKHFSFGIGAGGVYNGANISGPQGGRFQPMGLNVGQAQNPMQPQPPDVSRAAGFQHCSGAGTQGDNRMGRSEHSSTVRPSIIDADPAEASRTLEGQGWRSRSVTDPSRPTNTRRVGGPDCGSDEPHVGRRTQESRPCTGCRCTGFNS